MSDVRSLTGGSQMTGLDWKMYPEYHPHPDTQMSGEGSPTGEPPERKNPQEGSAQPLRMEGKGETLCEARGVSCKFFVFMPLWVSTLNVRIIGYSQWLVGFPM